MSSLHAAFELERSGQAGSPPGAATAGGSQKAANQLALAVAARTVNDSDSAFRRFGPPTPFVDALRLRCSNWGGSEHDEPLFLQRRAELVARFNALRDGGVVADPRDKALVVSIQRLPYAVPERFDKAAGGRVGLTMPYGLTALEKWDQLFLVASSAFVVFGPFDQGGAGVGPPPPLHVYDGRESRSEDTIKATNAKSLQRYMHSIEAALHRAKPWATYHAQESAWLQKNLGVGDFCMADDGGDAPRAATWTATTATWSFAERRALFIMTSLRDVVPAHLVRARSALGPPLGAPPATTNTVQWKAGGSGPGMWHARSVHHTLGLMDRNMTAALLQLAITSNAAAKRAEKAAKRVRVLTQQRVSELESSATAMTANAALRELDRSALAAGEASRAAAQRSLEVQAEANDEKRRVEARFAVENGTRIALSTVHTAAVVVRGHGLVIREPSGPAKVSRPRGTLPPCSAITGDGSVHLEIPVADIPGAATAKGGFQVSACDACAKRLASMAAACVELLAGTALQERALDSCHPGCSHFELRMAEEAAAALDPELRGIVGSMPGCDAADTYAKCVCEASLPPGPLADACVRFADRLMSSQESFRFLAPPTSEMRRRVLLFCGCRAMAALRAGAGCSGPVVAAARGEAGVACAAPGCVIYALQRAASKRLEPGPRSTDQTPAQKAAGRACAANAHQAAHASPAVKTAAREHHLVAMAARAEVVAELFAAAAACEAQGAAVATAAAQAAQAAVAAGHGEAPEAGVGRGLRESAALEAASEAARLCSGSAAAATHAHAAAVSAVAMQLRTHDRLAARFLERALPSTRRAEAASAAASTAAELASAAAATAAPGARLRVLEAEAKAAADATSRLERCVEAAHDLAAEAKEAEEEAARDAAEREAEDTAAIEKAEAAMPRKQRQKAARQREKASREREVKRQKMATGRLRQHQVASWPAARAQQAAAIAERLRGLLGRALQRSEAAEKARAHASATPGRWINPDLAVCTALIFGQALSLLLLFKLKVSTLHTRKCE